MEQYPEYVTQEQMCAICGISKKTAYKLERCGKIPYTVEVNYLIHTHRIRLTNILAYLYEKECRQESNSTYILCMRGFYEKQFSDYPDVVTVQDVEKMTGFSSSGILKWVEKKHLRVLIIKRRFAVPKVCLIDFLVSPYYRKIKNKSEKQKKDFKQFELWYEDNTKKGGVIANGSETRTRGTSETIS